MVVVLLFKDIMKTDLDKAGYKGLSISILANQGFNVPPGFVISIEAFKGFLKETRLKEKIDSLILKLNEENSEKVSLEIKKLILNSNFSKKLEEEIIEAYESLGFELNKLKITDLLNIKPSPLVAVRSSYAEKIEEDIPQPTFLNIKGKNILLNAIKKCWASLYDKDLILYRLKNNLSQDVSNTIVIQKMIDAEVSGIAFSSNPESKKKSEILIKACFGLGEVISEIIPDNYVVNKKDLTIKDAQVNEQKYAMLMDHARGVNVKKYLKEKSRLQKLNNRLITEVARITKRIAEQFKEEQAIEWCMFKERIFILQSKNLEVGFEDEKMEQEKEEIKEEVGEEKPTVDIYEPPLEEDIKALEEIETEDVDLSEKKQKPELETYGEKEPETTDEEIKKEEMERDEPDFFKFVDKVENSLEEKPKEETFKIDEEISKKEIEKEKIPTIDEIEEVKQEKMPEPKINGDDMPSFYDDVGEEKEETVVPKELEVKKDEASFDLIKDLTQKMESQLEDNDKEGYEETRDKLKRTLEGL